MTRPTISFAEAKQREEIAARRKAYEAKRDPEMEQCVIAYINRRADGHQQSFQDFARDWYARRGTEAKS